MQEEQPSLASLVAPALYPGMPAACAGRVGKVPMLGSRGRWRCLASSVAARWALGMAPGPSEVYGVPRSVAASVLCQATLSRPTGLIEMFWSGMGK